MVIFNRRLPKFDYLRPKTIEEAIFLLSQHKKDAKLFAGGTDLFPQMKRRQINNPKFLIDIKELKELNYITNNDNEGLRIGALATISVVEKSPIIKEKFSALAQAAYVMASPQVRNRGTIAGNICNAVPSADSAPALLSLGAKIKAISTKGERTINIEEFFTGRCETVLTDEELLYEIQIPPVPSNSKSIYLKLSPRHSMDLPIVGVAVLAISKDGVCKDIRISLGAVAPTPIRAKAAESILKGEKFNDQVIEKVAETAAGESRPITDHRASAEYRRDMVKVLVKRAINQIIL